MEKIKKEKAIQLNLNPSVVFHYTNEDKGEWDIVTINLLGVESQFSYQDILTKSVILNQYEYNNENTIGTLINTTLFQIIGEYILTYYNENYTIEALAAKIDKVL